jgi:hypothetical protein
MALPGTRIRCRPVDLLAAIRFLRYTKAKVSPRALRYEFEPDQPVSLVLEPWEHAIVLRDAEHQYTESRTIRTWGRRRLRLIEPLLPFAESVEIYLKGRALPSFYAVKLPGITFVLGLTGWSSQRWTETARFDLLTSGRGEDPGDVTRAGEWLSSRYAASSEELSTALAITKETAARVLERLCTLGRAVYDVESRQFRHRELFEAPIDEARLYPPDVRRERIQELLENNLVTVRSAQPRETVKTKRLKTPDGPVSRQVIYRDWQVTGSAGDQNSVELVVNDEGRLLFGTCACAFFKDNLLNKGPCEHLAALLAASAPSRKDQPTSNAAPSAERRRKPTASDDSEEPSDADE